MASLEPPDMPGRLRGHRSSVFEIPAGFKARHVGSSIMEFACEPKDDELAHHHGKQKQIAYENTYIMGPAKKFRADMVTPIINEVLVKNLDGKHYNPIECTLLSKSMAEEIKMKTKLLNFNRYKLVSVVTIGEKRDQGVRIGSRCIWDTDKDSFSTASFESPYLYAVGTLYAIYYE